MEPKKMRDTDSSEEKLLMKEWLDRLFIDGDPFQSRMSDSEIAECSYENKIRFNRLFREQVGGTYLPFPEVDTSWERFRSHMVIRGRLLTARRKK